MVPQLVPVAKEMTAPMINSRAGTNAGDRKPMVQSTTNWEVPSAVQTEPTPQAAMMIARIPAIFLMPLTHVSTTSVKVMIFLTMTMMASTMVASI